MLHVAPLQKLRISFAASPSESTLSLAISGLVRKGSLLILGLAGAMDCAGSGRGQRRGQNEARVLDLPRQMLSKVVKVHMRVFVCHACF